MNSLREVADEGFKHQRFGPRPSHYDVVTIVGEDATAEAETQTMRTESLSIEEIRSAAAPETKRGAQPPAIRLVKILFDQGSVAQTFHSSREDILGLFDAFGIDTCMLNMVSRRQCSFYRVGDSFYLKASSFMVVWTHHKRQPNTTAATGTQGVVFVRNIRRAHADFTQYLALLHGERGMICSQQPMLPQIVAAVQVASCLGRTVREQAARIKEVESTTGFHPWRNVPPASTVAKLFCGPASSTTPEDCTADERELRRLASMSQSMGASLVKLEHMMRQLRQNRQALMAFELPAADDKAETPGSLSQSHDASVRDAVRLLDAQFANSELDVEYLRERAKNQLSVIFNLMTRDEAWASIELARSAKQDGTSMKVIAVMTMAFLPATFFAALFATPSMEESAFIKESPWVFWACAVPCTAAVFVLWAALTRRNSRPSLNSSPRSPHLARFGSASTWGSVGGDDGISGGGGTGHFMAGLRRVVRRPMRNSSNDEGPECLSKE